MEAWSRRQIINVFSALAFAHLKMGKLEAQTERCIFMEYIEGMKGV